MSDKNTIQEHAAETAIRLLKSCTGTDFNNAPHFFGETATEDRGVLLLYGQWAWEQSTKIYSNDGIALTHIAPGIGGTEGTMGPYPDKYRVRFACIRSNAFQPTCSVLLVVSFSSRAGRR